MKRIAIVTESYLPTFNGVTNTVEQVSRQLTARGYEVLIIAPSIPPNATKPSVEEWGAQVVRVPSVLVPGKTLYRAALPLPQVGKAIEKFKPDVVHLASPILVGAAGAHAAQKLNIPSVSIFQTDIAGFAQKYGFNITGPVELWLRHIHNQTDMTLAPSSVTGRKLLEMGIRRVHLWGRGVDSVAFHPRKHNDAWRQAVAPNGEKIVGFVGRLAPEKQVQLMKVAHDTPGVKVVLVGDGPSRDELQKLMPNAHFTGMLRGEDLATALASFDVFVHTGPNETFCQTVQEAMASGVPVIAPAAGGPVDLVDHGERGFLFEPGSTDSLKLQLDKLLRNESLRKAFGATGRAFAESRTWSGLTDQLLGHYQSVTSEFARSGGPVVPARSSIRTLAG